MYHEFSIFPLEKVQSWAKLVMDKIYLHFSEMSLFTYAAHLVVLLNVSLCLYIMMTATFSNHTTFLRNFEKLTSLLTS